MISSVHPNPTPQVAPPSMSFHFPLLVFDCFVGFLLLFVKLQSGLETCWSNACDIICCGSGNCPHDWVLGCNFRFLSLPLPVIRYVEVKRIIPREYFGSCSTSAVSYSADNVLQFPKLVSFQHFEFFLSAICCGKHSSTKLNVYLICDGDRQLLETSFHVSRISL